MNNIKFTSFIFTSTLILFTFLTITSAQETTTPFTDRPSDLNSDPCRDLEVADCSICPCPALSSSFSEWMLAVTGLTAAFSFIFIIFMRLIKQIREKPGDLMLGSILSQIVFSLTIIVEKIGFPRFPNEENETDNSCIAFGLVKTISAGLINFYMATFFAVHLLSVKNYMKVSRMKSRYIHAAALLITVLFTVVLLTWRTIGVNSDGTCGMTSTPAILGPIVGYAVLAAFGLYVVYLGKKDLAARESLNRMQEEFIKHYMICLVIVSNLFLIAGIVALVANVMAVSQSLDAARAHTFGFIQFLLLNVCSLVLIITRLSDPLIAGHVKNTLKKGFCWWNGGLLIEGDGVSSEGEYTSPDSINDDIRIDMQKMVPLAGRTGLLQGSQRIFDTPQEETFEKDKKTKMVTSVLVSIAYFWKMNHLETIKKNIRDDEDYGIEYRRATSRRNIKEISVQEAPLKKLIPQVLREMKRRDKKLTTGFFTAFAPETFQRLIEHDNVLLELKDTWDFVSNYGNILSYGCQVDEYGKMFFLASNGKYVLQEISTQEKRHILDALPNYIGYLRTQPDSLLARIYGLYTFEMHDLSSQVHMIIVKNIGECGWRGIEKQYKLRGYNINNGSRKNSLKNCGYTPLSEKDFHANEKKIHLDTTSRDIIMDTLRKDVNFLEENSLGNYALQVSLVNKEKVCKGMVSSSVILEVEENSEYYGSMDQLKDGDLLFQRNLDEPEKEDSHDNVKTYIGIVDFWRDTVGKRSSFVWQTLKSLRRSSTYEKPEEPVVKHGDEFLKYVDSIV